MADPQSGAGAERPAARVGCQNLSVFRLRE